MVAVGGGTSGAVLASRLAEDENRTILLIEAGGSPTKDPDIDVPVFADTARTEDTDWFYRTVPQKFACKGHVDQVWWSNNLLKCRHFENVFTLLNVCLPRNKSDLTDDDLCRILLAVETFA